MAQRTCSILGCEKAHRARGYCVTHYNAVVLGERKRHPKEARSCIVCGTKVVRRSDKSYQPTCSVECRSIVQWGARLAQVSSYEWRNDAVKRARKAGVLIVERFDREDVFARDGWTCRACNRRCNEPNPFDLLAATIDHVVALADGGQHSRANAQTLCLSCNSAKRAGASPAASGAA